MNELKVTANKIAATEVASLLVPLDAKTLLLPTVTVAEMVPFVAPQKKADAPAWYLGDVIWREQAVPLMCFEVLSGGEMPSYASVSCRIAVINNTGVDADLPFIAIATQGIPRLSRVKPDEIHQLTDAKLDRYDLMMVSHAGDTVVIPDISGLEQTYVDFINGISD